MTRQLAARLSSQPWVDHGQFESQNAAWATLAHAFHLGHQGLGEQAYKLFQPHEGELPLSAGLLYSKACWATKANDPKTAHRDLMAAMRMPDAAMGTIARVALQTELGQAAFEKGDVEGAGKYCEAAVASAQGLPGAKPILVEVFKIQAAVFHKLSNPIQSVRCGERAIAVAVSVGSKALEARARLKLATVLTLLEVPGRARDVTEKALEVAQQCQMYSVEKQALRMMIYSCWATRKFEASVQIAAQLISAAQRAADFEILEHAQLCEFVALVYSHQLESAQHHPFSKLSARSLSAMSQPNFLIALAVCAWQRGDVSAALAHLFESLELPAAIGTKHHMYTRLLRSVFFTWIGDHQAASRELTLQEAIGGSSGTIALAIANQAAAQGRHLHAIAQLREYWMSEPTSSHDGVDLRLALAWLLLEDQNTDQRDDLDALAASLFDESPDLLSSKVFFAAYMLVRSPSPEAVSRWDRAIAHASVLRLRVTWIATANYRNSLIAGHPAFRLPMLLPFLCL